MTHTAAMHDSGPIAFRYPRGNGVGVEMPVTPERVWRAIQQGKTKAA